MRKYLNLSIASLLAILTLCLSIPFSRKYLYHIDSAQFALGMKHYAIADHQPHPPGYPLYIFLAKSIDYFIDDPNCSLIVLSIFFASLASIIYYYFTFIITRNRAVSIISSLFFITNPLFWFYREVALNYTFDALAGIIIAFLSYYIIINKKRIN